jgi:uncharacterized protein (TIGR04255 family)
VTTNLPKKLKCDAITEAIFEIRFDSTAVPEVIMGRIADNSAWSGFKQRRMPFAEVPAAVRNADTHMRYNPTIELVDGRNRMVRIGEHVLAFHVLEPYIGWQAFSPQLENMVDALFSRAPQVTVRRLGLRYLNAFTPERHGIHGLQNLNLTVAVSEERLTDSLNLSFARFPQQDMICVVRVLSPDFAEGTLPQGAVALMDVDVFTKERYRADKPLAVKDWLARAHEEKNHSFFGLLTPDTIAELRED